ncbi:hypothetical protein QR680_013348 [Steinernema hermaphroditum]|uniref:SH2 domain-containing protein n=1 Tax=Steinernema hermaphroditum TaxID=289476 RepID=A0AA39M246_9BILA|nr:hypothetical protein QR680_013348 [Steinernema hermaphroditum]
MRRKEGTKLKCCACAGCLCQKVAGVQKRKTKRLAEKATSEPSQASGYESIPDVCTDDLPVVEVSKKKKKSGRKEESSKSEKKDKDNGIGLQCFTEMMYSLTVMPHRAPNNCNDPAFLGPLNNEKGREELRRKLEALTLKEKLENEWKRQQQPSTDDDGEKSSDNTGRFSRRHDRELISVWSAFDLSNPANSQLRRSYPDPRQEKNKDTDTVYEKIEPNSLKEPPSTEASDKEVSRRDAVGTVAGEFYLGPMKIADAQKAVTECSSFKFYHRLPTKDFDSNDYSHMRDHLSLWIVFRNADGRFRHYIVRQERSDDDEGKKWGIRNYSKTPKKFARFQDLLKHYIANPEQIEKSRE